MSDIIKREENPVVGSEIQESNVELVTDQELKNLLDVLIKECDQTRGESLESYYIFRDLIANGGDFDSSPVVKEQLAVLLKTAQDATDSKIRLLESLIKTKIKTQVQINKINQNNMYLGNRRSLIEAIEQMKTSSPSDLGQEIEELINAQDEEIIEDLNKNDVDNDIKFDIDFGEK